MYSRKEKRESKAGEGQAISFGKIPNRMQTFPFADTDSPFFSTHESTILYSTSVRAQQAPSLCSRANALVSHLELRVDDRHFVGFGPHFAGSNKGVCGVHRRFDVVGDLDSMGTANASVRRRTAGPWTKGPYLRNLTEDLTRA